MRERAQCRRCGGDFFRDLGEGWKRLCYGCWLETRAPRRESAPPDELRDEFVGNLPALRQLCHPDRHNGSPMATRVTVWLNDVKRKLDLR